MCKAFFINIVSTVGKAWVGVGCNLVVWRFGEGLNGVGIQHSGGDEKMGGDKKMGGCEIQVWGGRSGSILDWTDQRKITLG